MLHSPPILAVTLPVRAALDRLLHALPGDDVELDFDFVWLERHAGILYPLLAVGTLALVALAIFSAWRSDELSGIVKVEYKREIIILLRREVGGQTVAKIAAHLKVRVQQAALMLEELQKDGILESQQRQRAVIWRLRGLSGR